MDMGIINSLKCHCKKIITANRIKCIENNRKFEITMLDALHYLNTAWERVSPETIRNCILKANFVQELILSKIITIKITTIKPQINDKFIITRFFIYSMMQL
jgi:hypothetical protein